MLRIHKILVPTDFSICAERAFAHAAYLADQFDAELHVLNVVIRHRRTSYGGSEPTPILESEIVGQLRLFNGDSHLQNSAADTMKVIQATVQHGSASVAIMDYADKHDIDLIVMGTHGRTGLDRWVSGSVAEEIIRFGACPVLTVQEGGRTIREGMLQRILVPVDFSEYSRASLKYASELARLYGSEVRVLHVIEEAAVPSNYTLEPGGLSDEELYERTMDALQRFVQQHGDGMDARLSVTVGHPGPAILEFVHKHDTDLLVISTHGRTGLVRLFMGSVSERIVRMAPCPVLTVKGHIDMLMEGEEGVLALEDAL